MLEPRLTGISYSFTDDGFYEEALYRAIANRSLDPTSSSLPMAPSPELREPSTAQNPACPKAIMQFQHGTFTKEANGSLILTPFGVDGRQLLSDPCKYKNSVYTRYDQIEMIKVRGSLTLDRPGLCFDRR